MVMFDEQFLKNRLESISPHCRALFALTCAERLFPLYQLFSEKTGRGRPNYLRSTLDHLWELALSGETGYKESFLGDYQSLILGENAEWDLLNGLADDAVASLAYACQCQLTGETQSAYWAAVRGYEAVDYTAHTLEGMDYDTPAAEVAILQKEYVQAEIQRQLRDVAELESVACNGTELERFVKTLRNRAKSEGMTLVSIVSVLNQ